MVNAIPQIAPDNDAGAAVRIILCHPILVQLIRVDGFKQSLSGWKRPINQTMAVPDQPGRNTVHVQGMRLQPSA